MLNECNIPLLTLLLEVCPCLDNYESRVVEVGVVALEELLDGYIQRYLAVSQSDNAATHHA